MTSLQAQVALITGASRGIGRAIALGLARDGCNIVIAAKSVESTDKLPGSIYTVAQEVEALGVQALPVRVDVRDEQQIEALAAQTLQRFGRVDILVNNAGALFWQPLLETPANRFDLVLGINARAAFLCCRAVLPSMIERRQGHIINMMLTNNSAIATLEVSFTTKETPSENRQVHTPQAHRAPVLPRVPPGPAPGRRH